MITGKLYEQAGIATSQDLDIVIPKSEMEKFDEVPDQSTVEIEAKVTKGYTGNAGQVFIKKRYEVMTTDEGISLDEIEIIKVNGNSESKEDLYPEGTKITLQGNYGIGLITSKMLPKY